MMKATGYFSLLIVVCLLIEACSLTLAVEENDLVPSSSAPTITAFLCPQDSIHKVLVTYTAPAIGAIDEQEFYQDLKETIVQISAPGRSAILQYDSTRRFFYVKANTFRLLAGETYRVVVSMPKLSPATASCTIPTHKINDQSVSWNRISHKDNNMDDWVAFQWADIANETNYYAFWSLRTYYNASSNRFEVQSEVPQFVISDLGLENGQITANPVSIPAKVLLGNGNFETTEVFICNTDKNYYQYHKLLAQLRRDQNPFTEPVRLSSNVTNGFGVVAGYTRIRLAFF